MSRLTPLKAEESIRRLRSLGFDGPFGAGRHLRMVHPRTQKVIPVPMHRGRDVGVGLIRAILREECGQLGAPCGHPGGGHGMGSPPTHSGRAVPNASVGSSGDARWRPWVCHHFLWYSSTVVLLGQRLLALGLGRRSKRVLPKEVDHGSGHHRHQLGRCRGPLSQ